MTKVSLSLDEIIQAKRSSKGQGRKVRHRLLTDNSIFSQGSGLISAGNEWSKLARRSVSDGSSSRSGKLVRLLLYLHTCFSFLRGGMLLQSGKWGHSGFFQQEKSERAQRIVQPRRSEGGESNWHEMRTRCL